MVCHPRLDTDRDRGFSSPRLISGPLHNLWVVVVALVGWSGVMWIAERVGKRDRPESSLNLKDAVIIGLVQCFALIPGVSRSGRPQRGPVRDLDRVAATRLAFFLAIPALVAAGGYEAIKEASSHQYGGRLVAHRVGNGGQLCGRVRVNRLVVAIRGQTQHHGVHLVSRGTGGGHRDAARHRAAGAPDVIQKEPSTDASRRRWRVVASPAAKADGGAGDTSMRGSAGERYPGTFPLRCKSSTSPWPASVSVIDEMK